jgi:transcriptional regulator with XRE-family HTH domain
MMSIKFPNPTDKYVGSRVRMRRLMLHMSQERLAGQLGLTFQQVQKYEKGTNRISASRLQEISHILEVPVPFFFEGAPQSFGGARKSGDGPSLAYITDFLGNADGHALVRAFIKIKNTSLRRSVVRLVEAIVASGES